MFNIISNKKEHNLKLNLKSGSQFLKDIINHTPPKQGVIHSQKVFRQDGISVEKIIETNTETGKIIRVINFDYFNDKKIKSIEEYEDDIKIRFTAFSFFKSVTEFDRKTGKKIKTTNYNIKDDTRKISVYDYDIESGKIVRMSVYRTDGKNLAFIKEISPDTGIVSRCINYKKNSSAISSVSKYEVMGSTTVKTTYYYSTPVYEYTPDTIDRKITADILNKKVLDSIGVKNVGKLIDNLYRRKQNFSTIKVS
ncbi:DUF2963 domain-containing protein [bacterium]|nr:DUF2963 domain-containing protein [bacterium]